MKTKTLPPSIAVRFWDAEWDHQHRHGDLPRLVNGSVPYATVGSLRRRGLLTEGKPGPDGVETFLTREGMAVLGQLRPQFTKSKGQG